MDKTKLILEYESPEIGVYNISTESAIATVSIQDNWKRQQVDDDYEEDF